MFNRPLGQGVNQNTLVDSPFFQQDNQPPEFNPVPQNAFLLLNGQPFKLLNGNYFELLK